MKTTDLILEILKFFFDSTLHFIELIILIMLIRGNFTKIKNSLRKKTKEVKSRYQEKIKPEGEKRILPKFLRKEDTTTEEYLQK